MDGIVEKAFQFFIYCLKTTNKNKEAKLAIL
jgi:hypothetical protein